jgi:hypothetical protein
VRRRRRGLHFRRASPPPQPTKPSQTRCFRTRAHLASSTCRDPRLTLLSFLVFAALKTVQERVYRNCSCSFFSLQLSKSSVNPPAHLTLAEILILYKSDCLVHWICPWVQILELYTSWVQIPPAQLKAPIFIPFLELQTLYSFYCFAYSTFCVVLKTNFWNFKSYKLYILEYQKNLIYILIKLVSTIEQLKFGHFSNLILIAKCCINHNFLSTTSNWTIFISKCISEIWGIQISHFHASLASSWFELIKIFNYN